MCDFYGCWFAGLEAGLNRLNEKDRKIIMQECGKACSASYSLGVYRKIRGSSSGISDFFRRLNEGFTEISVTEIREGKEYEIRYDQCFCELYTQGRMHGPVFCECSRQSMLHNLQNVFPQHAFSVRMIRTIQEGAVECLFRVTVRKECDA